jgi:Glycosyl transferase family 2
LHPGGNGEQNIEPLSRAQCPVMERASDFRPVRLCASLTDYRSTDRSFEILEQLAGSDSGIQAIRFSRNFGFQGSIFTAYANARGDATVQIDCDLQDRPGLILDFIKAMGAGFPCCVWSAEVSQGKLVDEFDASDFLPRHRRLERRRTAIGCGGLPPGGSPRSR